MKGQRTTVQQTNTSCPPSAVSPSTAPPKVALRVGALIAVCAPVGPENSALERSEAWAEQKGVDGMSPLPALLAIVLGIGLTISTGVVAATSA